MLCRYYEFDIGVLNCGVYDLLYDVYVFDMWRYAVCCLGRFAMMMRCCVVCAVAVHACC